MRIYYRSKVIFILATLYIATSNNVYAQLNKDQARRIEAAIPKKARVTPKKERCVLIWNTPFMDQCPHKGFCVPQGEYAMKMLGEKTGAFKCVVSDDVAMYLPENIKQFDAIIMNNSNGRWIRPTEKDMPKFKKYGDNPDVVEKLLRKSLIDYVRNGRGVVAYHHAIGGNNDWPEFKELIGAGYWGHPWNEEVGIKLDEPEHPLLKAFAGNDFRLADEIFQFQDPYSRKKLRVLLSLDIAKTNMTVPWIHRNDNDFALAWIHSFGKGRVFYSAIGHRTEIWWNPVILEFYLDGIQFATGDLPADTTPSAKLAGPIERGFKSLFNGNDLTGWTGNPRIWSVKDGAITGQTTPENRISENDFLIWTGGNLSDFELRLKFRIENGNSGIYFHSAQRNDMRQEALIGPQADISFDGRWTGVIMEYTLREILAERGQIVHIDENGKIDITGTLNESEKLLGKVKQAEWNEYTIITKGGHTTLIINGATMCDVQDDDPNRPTTGKLALQIHRGPDMLVQFKDIRIREL